MLKITFLLLLGSVLMGAEPNEITKGKLVEMFGNIAHKTQWDLAKPMLWGYFFTNKTESTLKTCGDALVKSGYRFVKIYEIDKTWWLHVEREEIHTVDTLFLRNKELYKFASNNGLTSYDGMDIGPIAK